MELTPYVETLRRGLMAAAETGSDDTWVVAERLVASLEPATRLALLEALSAAADEITRDLAPGSVEVRLRGVDPELVVTLPPASRPFDDVEDDDPVPAPPPAPSPPPEAEDGGTSRITLRLPESMKPRIEEASRQAGLSVNAWLVRVVSAGLDGGGRGSGFERGRGTQLGRSYQGWAR